MSNIPSLVIRQVNVPFYKLILTIFAELGKCLYA